MSGKNHKREEKMARNRAASRPSLDPKRSVRAGKAAVWAWDIRTGAASFAREWRDILALPAGQRQGRTMEYLFSRMRRSDCDILRTQCAEIADGTMHSLDIAVRMRRADNTWAWVLLRGETGNEEADACVFAGIGMEISRLRLDKRFFPPFLDDFHTTCHTLPDHSPNNIIRFDRERFPLHTNPTVSTDSPGAPEGPGSKKAADGGMAVQDIGFLQAHVERVFESGEVIRARHPIVTETGALVADFSFWPEFDETGAVRSVLALQQDLTAKVKREDEAQTNEMRFSSLYQLTQMDDAPEEEVLRFFVEKIAELTGSRYSHLHMLPDALDPRGSIVWSASHAAFMSNGEFDTPDPVLVRTEFGFDIETAPEPTTPVLRNVGVSDSSGVFFGGRLPITRYLCAPAMQGGRPMCVAAVYNKDDDYTKEDMRQLQLFISGAWLVLRRRRHMAELTAAKESAELANKVKDRFLANVSHELRTPLNGMLSMLQLLEMTPLATDQTEYAKSATVTGQTLLRIISDILDFSKMESGKLELDKNPFNFKGCLLAVVGLFRVAAKKKGLKLMLTTMGDYPSLVHGDEARIRQILFNLVGNALKFTERGEIEVFCEARHMSDGLITTYLTVRDTGIGIPLEMQTKVFDAFIQVDGSSTRRHQGAGLGLGIVRQLVEAMGGAITLKSTPGQGTTVECALPFTMVPEDLAVGAATPPVDAALPDCPALTILVAEDDTVSRHAMRLFLQKLGHRAVCVTNGREALEALRLYSFDCLISDVLMPEMDGLEATRRIREGDCLDPSPEVRTIVSSFLQAGEVATDPLPIPRDIPIVAISAHAMKGDREHFLDQGMDYYLSKPAKLKDLAAVLLRIYENREP